MQLIGIIIFIVVTLIIFLLFREFWCWYWKINERNKILRDISQKLDTLNQAPTFLEDPRKANSCLYETDPTIEKDPYEIDPKWK